MEHVLGILAGVGIAVVILGTAPWWFPVFDPVFSWWLEWVDRTIEKREKRRSG